MDEPQGVDRAEALERGRMSAEELSWSLRAVNRAAADLDQALAAKMGLRALDYGAMGQIMDSEDAGLGPAQLGHRLGISTGSASELVDRLERAGHVSRVRDGADRRRVHLTPRPATVNRILGELGPLFAALDELSAGFTPQERAAIDAYLRGAAARLQAHAATLAGTASGPQTPGVG